MNQRTRDALHKALGSELPKGFVLELFDEFIDYTPEGRMSGCRVLRVVGPGRMLVLFRYPASPFENRWAGRNYDMLYLRDDGELLLFAPDTIVAAWCLGNGKDWDAPANWEKIVGSWLAKAGVNAMAFKGRGWANSCAAEILRLVGVWQTECSGME